MEMDLDLDMELDMDMDKEPENILKYIVFSFVFGVMLYSCITVPVCIEAQPNNVISCLLLRNGDNIGKKEQKNNSDFWWNQNK